MARPAIGCPKWSERKKVWIVRVTLPTPKGAKPKRKPVPMPGIAEHDVDEARSMALVVSELARTGGATTLPDGASVSDYAGNWIKDRETRGITTFKHDESRLRLHVLPILGPFAIATVGRADIERVVEDLDLRIALDPSDERHLAWKTASNVWTLVTKMFDDAVNSKTRTLRVRSDNPAGGIRPPESGDRKAKQYLYPSEFLKLVSCDVKSDTGRPVVSLRHRTLYAAAVYTFARAGELEALTWDDVDLEHQVITINKAIDRRTSKVKSTKSGEARRIPIEPALLPLLERLNAERPKRDPGTSRVFWLPKDDVRATQLRDHLMAAGVTRAELHVTDAHRKNLTFHDLRATGLTWMAVRGDQPLSIKQRAGHRSFSTTEIYIREAENLSHGFGETFPELPNELTESFGLVSVRLGSKHQETSVKQWSKGGSNP